MLTNKGKIGKSVLAATGVIAMSLFATTPAHASGFATRPIGTFTWNYQGVDINVPTGCFLNMKVNGTGTHVDSTIANVDCIGPAATVPGLFCNYRGKYIFKDSDGNEYASEETAVHEGCGQASYPIDSMSSRDLQTGSICLDLELDGNVRGTTCIAVFP